MVKVNVAVPADTPVTTPAFVTVATEGLLLVQMPVVGVRLVVLPMQMLAGPVIVPAGVLLTVTAGVGDDVQPVAVLVKVKVAVPAETPVTTPAFVTVATALLLLAQVPPLVGDKPVLAPMQMLVEPVMLPTGNAFTVTVPVGADTHPVMALVNAKVTVPAEMPVTTPLFVTVAMEGSLLVQLPPDVGDKAVVNPTQMLLEPVMLTTGKALTVTAGVGDETHPVAESVNENVAGPADTPVTTPAFVTVAIPGLLLAQVPPVAGDKVVVVPTQMVPAPAMLTTGKAMTVTAAVVAEQLGAMLLVKVKVAVPADTPVTTPPLVTVAMEGSLLVQVPPDDGDKVVVMPTQTELAPTILTTGKAVTETAEVGREVQPVAVLVNVNVAVPAVTPVTTPPFVTVATAGLLLAQVPPVVGDKAVVEPTQMLLAPVTLTEGRAFTVMGGVAADAHPVAVFVKVNVAVPAETPVTTPALVTVATELLLLVQVPPVEGDKVVVEPIQMVLDPAMLTGVRAFTVTAEVVALQLGAIVFVKVKVTVPAVNPVTRPPLVTDATVGSLLVQVPPTVGVRVVVLPAQIVLEPVMLTAGRELMVTADVGAETQPVVEFVNVNVTEPADTPVTTPPFVTVARVGSLLTQVPPDAGDKVVVLPIQILLEPVTLTAGMALTVTDGVGADMQPLDVLVNVKVALPAATPVTTPALVTVAFEASLLTQVPPDVGETPVDPPTQMLLVPVRLTLGAVTMVMDVVEVEVHPLASVTVTV